MEKDKGIQVIRGTFDVLPEDFYVYEWIRTKIKDCFESFGYLGIDVPIIEYAELHLRKSGEDIISKMYTFKDYGNRNLCLRPELTAPVVRAFANEMKGVSFPIRLCYFGPAFRYDKPQRGRYRQFSQAGIELIGSKSPLSDAEIIGLACKGLEVLGLKNYRLVIGNMGFMLHLLNSLELDERLKSFFVESMEQLSKQKNVDDIRNWLKELDIDFENPENTGFDFIDEEFISSIKKMEFSKAKTLLLGVLREINVGLNGRRSPEEIAERLLVKIRRRGQRENIDKVLDFIKRLTLIKGRPPKIFDEIKELIKDYKLSDAPLIELEKTVKNLECFNIDWNKTTINLGFGRGLEYYTGMIFEIYYDQLGTENQICGGGRYDDLVNVISGNSEVPALGFAYGLERVKLALEEENKSKKRQRRIDVFIMPSNRETDGYAIKIADLLRNKGLKVETDVMERKIGRNLDYANKKKIPFVIFAGEDEKNISAIKLKNMQSGNEQIITLDKIDEVSTIVKENENVPQE